MIYFQEQEHDFTETTYIAISKRYRWWVSIDHEKKSVSGLQVCRILWKVDGFRTFGDHIYSNMPESEVVNTLHPKVVDKIKALSVAHYERNGRKGDFREYKKPFRSQGMGSPLAHVSGSTGQRGGFKEDMGIRQPKGIYERDSKYSPDLELQNKADTFDGSFQSQPRSQWGINRFC